MLETWHLFSNLFTWPWIFGSGNAKKLDSLPIEEKARVCSILAEFYKQENNYSEGINSYKQAYDLYNTIDDTEGVMSSMVGILGLNLLLEDCLK